MNIRSLTRGDGVVIGAAVVLFIASFLDTFDSDGSDIPNAWDNLGLVMSMYVGGIVGAVLIVLARALAQPRKVVGLDLGQVGVAFTVFAAWTSFWTIVDPLGALDENELFKVDAGAGLILGLIAALLLAAGAIATPLVPALQAPWSRPPSRSPRSPTAPSRPVVTATRVPSRSSRTVRSRSRASRSASSRRPPRPPLRASRPRRLRPRTSRRTGSPCR